MSSGRDIVGLAYVSGYTPEPEDVKDECMCCSHAPSITIVLDTKIITGPFPPQAPPPAEEEQQEEEDWGVLPPLAPAATEDDDNDNDNDKEDNEDNDDDDDDDDDDEDEGDEACRQQQP
ncbi:hypothetical protein M3J09_006785 [Ascochyta lentis]